jgi:CheY-like chemotaxis protein
MNEKNPKQILVIEDESAVSKAIQDVLEIQGYEVCVAGNGAEALELLKKSGTLPCLILLDLMMPRMNGWEFLDIQKADPELSKIPVVICSAYKESATAIKPSAVIIKPVQRNTLLQTVQSFCA